MDLFFIIGGAFLGGIFAGIIAVLIPDTPIPVRVAIECIGLMLGLVAGYVITWKMKQEELEEIQIQKKQQAVAVPVLPQIVGNKCAQCGNSIMFVIDAHVCLSCNQVNCKVCSPELPCPSCIEREQEKRTKT